MAKMILYGGEKDGYGQDGELKLSARDRPDVFYAVPNADDERIRTTRGNDAKRELRDRLAVLAYEYDPTDQAEHPDVFVMRRNPSLDKVRQP
jgi:hypothetical protein